MASEVTYFSRAVSDTSSSRFLYCTQSCSSPFLLPYRTTRRRRRSHLQPQHLGLRIPLLNARPASCSGVPCCRTDSSHRRSARRPRRARSCTLSATAAPWGGKVVPSSRSLAHLTVTESGDATKMVFEGMKLGPAVKVMPLAVVLIDRNSHQHECNVVLGVCARRNHLLASLGRWFHVGRRRAQGCCGEDVVDLYFIGRKVKDGEGSEGREGVRRKKSLTHSLTPSLATNYTTSLTVACLAPGTLPFLRVCTARCFGLLTVPAALAWLLVYSASLSSWLAISPGSGRPLSAIPTDGEAFGLPPICFTRVGGSAATVACEQCLCESRILLRLSLALAPLETYGLNHLSVVALGLLPRRLPLGMFPVRLLKRANCQSAFLELVVDFLFCLETKCLC